MQFFPAALQDLSDHFARLPGIGGKTAQRLAFHVLELPLEDAQAFADAILEAKKSVHTCPCCQNITDREICPICDDPSRDKDVICVVAEPKDVIAMERSREFRGGIPCASWCHIPIESCDPGGHPHSGAFEAGQRRHCEGSHNGHQSRHRGRGYGHVHLSLIHI